VTYIFYRLNKKIAITFELVSIDKALQPLAAPNIAAGFVPVIAPDVRAAILKELDRQLIAAGILGNDGKPSDELKKEFDFKLESHLPTAGIIVKGCLDECNTCEPARRECVHLENEMLRKQIELLEKSQEYRCCPGEAQEKTQQQNP
jgi:hypothetical protein